MGVKKIIIKVKKKSGSKNKKWVEKKAGLKKKQVEKKMGYCLLILFAILINNLMKNYCLSVIN